MGGLLFQAFIYLCAAVIAVPLAKRLGLGSVLGYLLAGIVIGPIIGLVGSETQQIQHFAEFGVVMMLFLVGLELHPGMLWEMRTRLLGLGGLQVFLTAGLIAGAAALFGLAWKTAIVIGLIFALSSTAIVLQTLNEKGLTRTDGGRAGFSVLLFQDIAVIPMLAVIPLLAIPQIAGEGLAGPALEAVVHGSGNHHGDFSLVADLPGWAHTLVVLGAVAFVLFGGHFLSRPLFRIVAESRLREIFTASALFLVIGIALLMTLVELSPALGTFLAGVVLANSEFRHELESNVEPFKGLLLGLFFITVGAGIDFGILFEDFFLVLGLTLGVFLVKGLVLFALARLFRLKPSDRWLMTLGLAQAGEFGFVLLSFSLQRNAIPADLASLLSLVVALSMLVTPILFIVYEKQIEPRLRTVVEQEADAIEETGSVIIAGNGRFGQIVNRLLVASGITTVVLDHEPNMVDMLRKFGIKAYYGDASRPELLHAAGIEHAKVLVVAICDRERSAVLVKYVKSNYPHVKILARAHDVNHLYLLQNAGVDLAVREMFDGSLRLGSEVLKALGFPPAQVDRMAQTFCEHDHASLDQLYHLWDENPDVANNKAFLALAREHAETLKSLMIADQMDLPEQPESTAAPQPGVQGQGAE